MCKGKIIKDDTDWKDYPEIKDGCQILLMDNQMDKQIIEDMLKSVEGIDYVYGEEGNPNLKKQRQDYIDIISNCTLAI